jgi:hypothetical protein
MVWISNLTDILGANPIHAIFKMNSISVSVLLVVWDSCAATIPTASTLLARDVTTLLMRSSGMVTLRKNFLDRPLHLIPLLFARSAKFLLHVLQFVLL